MTTAPINAKPMGGSGKGLKTILAWGITLKDNLQQQRQILNEYDDCDRLANECNLTGVHRRR